MKDSTYMHWAKTRPPVRFDLALSGVIAYPLEKLPFDPNEVIVTGQSMYGYEPLQQAIATRYGVTTDHVVAANGTSFANHLAMAAILNPGDQIVLEEPIYEPILAMAKYLRVDIVRFQRRFSDGFRINVEDIARRVSSRTKLIVLTNLHNPSSVLTDQSTLKELAAVARRVKARILVDEVYLGALFENEPPSAVHLGPEFVTTNSLTKAYGLAGLRCGWILAEPDLAREMWRLNDIFGVSQPHVAERLATQAFGFLPQIAQRAKDLLDRNRKLMNEFLASRPDLETVPVEYGTTVFPRWPNRYIERLTALLFDKYETQIVPGKFFEMSEHFRLGLCCETEMLVGGLERLGQALDEM